MKLNPFKKDSVEVKPETKEEVNHDGQEQPKPAGINEQLKEIRETLDLIAPKPAEGKIKPVKMPWKMKRQLKKLAKQDKVEVFLLKTNRSAFPIVAKIENEMIKINDKYYRCSEPFVYLWMGKYPAIFLPEWSLTPIGTKDYYEAMKEGKFGVSDESVIIQAMKMAQLDEKKKFSGMTLLWFIIGIGVLAYVFFGGK